MPTLPKLVSHEMTSAGSRYKYRQEQDQKRRNGWNARTQSNTEDFAMGERNWAYINSGKLIGEWGTGERAGVD